MVKNAVTCEQDCGNDNSVTEICNGIDDDGNGRIDDKIECYACCDGTYSTDERTCTTDYNGTVNGCGTNIEPNPTQICCNGAK